MLPPSHGAYGGVGPLLLGVSWALAGIATVTISARAYAALRLVERPAWDLFWVLVAWALCLVAEILLSVSVVYGIGNHIWLLTPNDIVQGVKWSWIAQYVALFASEAGKIAVIALLLLVQGRTHPKKRYFLHFAWLSNTVINTAQLVLLVLQCSPAKKLWDDSVPGTCGGRVRAEYTGFFQGSWAAATDVSLAIYPVFVFWQLKMSWPRRLGLCLLMSGGVVAGAVTAIKTYYIHVAPETDDPTYGIYPLILCAFVEIWMIIILGSVPQLRILFVHLFRKAHTLITERGTATGTGRGRSRLSSSMTKNSGGIVQLQEFPYSSQSHAESRKYKSGLTQDNESEEEILPQLGAIRVRTDYDVSYEKAPGQV